MLNDRFAKTVVIPVKVENGRLTFFYGGDLPPLKDGFIGELKVPVEAFKDKRWTELLNAEREKELLPADSEVFVGVQWNLAKPELLESLIDLKQTAILWGIPTHGFVKVILKEPLRLQLKGTRRAKLMGCSCRIPMLEQLKHDRHEAGSLNEAYTLISTVFEPSRRSHAGNVFNLCACNVQGKWYLLDDLRMKYEAEYEGQLATQMCQMSNDAPTRLAQAPESTESRTP